MKGPNSAFGFAPRQELVLEVAELSDARIKAKVMKTVSRISGIESVSVDTNTRKLTLKGNMDPVKVVGKLRKLCCTDIVSVGSVKKEEPKKDAKEKTEKPKNESKEKESCTCQQHPAHMGTPYPYYYYCTVEENPDRGCVIC